MCSCFFPLPLLPPLVPPLALDFATVILGHGILCALSISILVYHGHRCHPASVRILTLAQLVSSHEIYPLGHKCFTATYPWGIEEEFKPTDHLIHAVYTAHNICFNRVLTARPILKAVLIGLVKCMLRTIRAPGSDSKRLCDWSINLTNGNAWGKHVYYCLQALQSSPGFRNTTRSRRQDWTRYYTHVYSSTEGGS
ncbi:hypothetical protein BS47DRAFT_900531 [Hydnum rufescens UP504]|uniref:Uncharacterized protein n=1 Tax=Hydnum rufescens UP504 TaxID=1448309 RepID=A0A9P6B0K9_9AGAM|nr:hypothetical protein BS47DRAFT_900531 [Hydnum rufescens UP504]